MKTKICYKCKKRKPISEFYYNKGRKNNLDDWCKSCHRVRYKRYYKENREHILMKEKLQRQKFTPEEKNKLNAYNRKYYAKNRIKKREYMNAYARKWRRKHPEKDKLARLKRDYNLTFLDIKKMKVQQDNKCLICDYPLPNNFVIDHDHKTGKVRGLLCRRCNTSLGLFRDDPNILKRAINYLKIGEIK